MVIFRRISQNLCFFLMLILPSLIEVFAPFSPICTSLFWPSSSLDLSSSRLLSGLRLVFDFFFFFNPSSRRSFPSLSRQLAGLNCRRVNGEVCCCHRWKHLDRCDGDIHGHVFRPPVSLDVAPIFFSFFLSISIFVYLCVNNENIKHVKRMPTSRSLIIGGQLLLAFPD